jgi:hypothetical protein
MAYETVVEMLGENLASLLELAKKWLTDWAIKPKELLTTFHQIRKIDLKGLIGGTHEIRQREKTVDTTSFDNEYFEQIFESDYITIPDMVMMKKYIIEKWNYDIADARPSMPLETGMRKKIKVFSFKKRLSSQRCVDFIKNIPGALLPNVFGLAVAEIMIGSELPIGRDIYGFDNYINLSTGKDSRALPYFSFYSTGSTGNVACYSRAPFGANHDIKDVLILLCD